MWIGVHYEYPFGGMTVDRPEWKPKGAADWRRDLAVIADTGFNLIRIRVGLDSNIDDIAVFLDICRDLDLKVVLGSAMFYVSDEFVRTYPDSKTVLADGTRIPEDELDYRWPRACVHHPVFRRRWHDFFDACGTKPLGKTAHLYVENFITALIAPGAVYGNEWKTFNIPG